VNRKDIPLGDQYSITIITSIYKRIDFKDLATRVTLTQETMERKRKTGGSMSKRNEERQRGRREKESERKRENKCGSVRTSEDRSTKELERFSLKANLLDLL